MVLGKVLGIITAGVFIGAAAFEISRHIARKRDNEEHDRKYSAPIVPDVEATIGHEELVLQAG